MPINLDDYRKIHECKGNKHNRIFVVEHRESKEISILKVIGIRNLQRQLREIETHCSVHGDFIIKLKDYHVTTNHIFMLIEFAKHGDLFSFIPKLREASQPTLLRFYYQVVLAIDYLHSRGFVHRDIKPENILIASKYVPKLADVGASSKIGLIKNTFCGTYEYMAPEIMNRQQQTEMVDIWALGILLYEMCMGKTPFKNLKPEDIRVKLAGGDLGFPPGFDKQLREFIQGVLQFDPKKRPTARQMVLHPIFNGIVEKVASQRSFEVHRESLTRVFEDRGQEYGGQTNSQPPQPSDRYAASKRVLQSDSKIEFSQSLGGLGSPKNGLGAVHSSNIIQMDTTNSLTMTNPLARSITDTRHRNPVGAVNIPNHRQVLAIDTPATLYYSTPPKEPQNKCSIDASQTENKHPPVIRMADLFKPNPSKSRGLFAKASFGKTAMLQREKAFELSGGSQTCIPAPQKFTAPSATKFSPLGLALTPSQRLIQRTNLDMGCRNQSNNQVVRSNRKIDSEDYSGYQTTPVSTNKQPFSAKLVPPTSEKKNDSNWLDTVGRFGSTAKIFFARFKSKQD